MNGRLSNKRQRTARNEGVPIVDTRAEGAAMVRQTMVGGAEGEQQTHREPGKDLVGNREGVSVNIQKEDSEKQREGDKGEYMKIGEIVRESGQEDLEDGLDGREGAEGRVMCCDIVMRDSGAGKMVLVEMEQNNKEGKKDKVEGSTKIGSWKRKARAKGKETMLVQGSEINREERRDNFCGKKRVSLGDEEVDVVSISQAEKKLKLQSEKVSISDNVVEVTSQKWAQTYQ